MIEAGKTYKTRGGEEAVIYATDGVGNHPIHGAISGRMHTWMLDGRYSTIPMAVSELDLVLEPSYADFKIDEPVMVRDLRGLRQWVKHHFAGVNHKGKPTTFACGYKSWSNTDATRTVWDECRRPTEDEL